MRINELNATNLHGQNFGVALSLVNVICGDNFRGKTAIMKAIRLGLTGYLPPPIGKMPGNIYKLAGNPEGEGEMRIDLMIDGGRQINLAWKRDAKGRVSTEGSVPDDLAMPALLCEPRTFFAMTGADRIKTVFGACDLSKSGFGADTIKKRLSEVQQMPAKVCEETLNTIEQRVGDAFDGSTSVQDSTNILLAYLKVEQKNAADKAKTASGAFAAFRQKIAASRPADLTAEITKLETEIAQSGVSNEVERQRLWQQIEALKNRLADEFAILSEHEATGDARVKKMGDELAALTKKLNNEIVKDSVDEASIEKEVADLTGKKSVLCKQAEAARVELGSQKEMLATLAKLKLCAKCKKTLKGEAEKKVAELEELITKLENDIEHVNETGDMATSRLTEAQKANTSQNALVSQLETEIETKTTAKKMLTAAIAEYSGLVTKFQSLPAQTSNDAPKAKLAELRQQQDAFIQHKRDLARRDELEQELLTEQCKEAVFKAVTKMVLEEQDKVMTFAFNEVLKVARHFTDGLLNSPLEFYNGELGRRVSEADNSNAPIGSWISHETFSGTEELLAYAGFSVALAHQAPMRIVFFDELGRIEPKRKLAMLERMVELTSKGILDQVIMVDVDNKWITGEQKSLVNTVSI